MSILVIPLSFFIYFVVGIVLFILLAVPEDDTLLKIALLVCWPLVLLTYVVMFLMMIFVMLFDRDNDQYNFK